MFGVNQLRLSYNICMGYLHFHLSFQRIRFFHYLFFRVGIYQAGTRDVSPTMLIDFQRGDGYCRSGVCIWGI